MSLASIEISESQNTDNLHIPLKRLEESYDILVNQAKELMEIDTFHHEFGNLLNEFGRIFRRFNDSLKALDFFEKALKIAILQDSKVNISAICYNIANLYIKMKKYKEAMDFLRKSEKNLDNFIGKSEKNDKKNIVISEVKSDKFKPNTGILSVNSKNNDKLKPNTTKTSLNSKNNDKLKANICDSSGNSDKLKQNAAISKGNHEELTIKKELANCWKLMAEVFYNEQTYDKSEEFGLKSLDFFLQIYGELHINLIEIYNFMAVLYLTIGKHEKSLMNFEKALEISQKFYGENDGKLVKILNNMGILYNLMGKNEESEKILMFSEGICEKNGMRREKAHVYYNLGNLFIKLKNVENSLEKSLKNAEKSGSFLLKSRLFLEKAKEIFKEFNDENEKLAFISFNLGGIEVGEKQFKKAGVHFRESIESYKCFLGEKDYEKNGNVKKMKEFLKKDK